ncbi:MAG TPA: hypothetical protein PKI03_05500 [Pseudomonadota bacterium]|jgi:cell division protein ZapA (FtsZ GTPase activity inhibitor)|nr:hypothetical protein [Pseudomonadota bacterium]
MSEPGFASERAAQRQADLHYLDNSIDIAFYLSCEDNRPPFFSRAQCKFLPFLSTDLQFQDELRHRLNDQLSTRKLADWRRPEEIRAALQRATATLLDEYCGIRLSPLISIEIQLCGENATKGLVMKQTDWLRWIPYGRFLVDNCAKLQVNHLLLVYQRLVFAPSPAQAALDLQIQTPLDFHISRIAIAADDSVLAAHEAPLIIKTPQGQLRLPNVAIRHYPRMRAAKALTLTLTLANQSELTLSLDPKRVETADLSEAPYVYFVDMGSTFYKDIRIELKGPYAVPLDGSDAAAGAKRISSLVKDALTERSQEGLVNARGPIETSRITRELGIPEFKKKELATADTTAQARWIADAIHCLAANAAKKRRALAYVVWSFPNIDGKLHLKELVEQVDALTRDVVLYGVMVLSEHEALRHRFQGILSFMASEAAKGKQAIKSAQSTNAGKEKQHRAAEERYQKEKKEYSELWFFKRWFAEKPIEPDAKDYAPVEVPSLADWQADFLEIAADPQLRDVVILDAGGYSLDVYCQVDGNVYGQSFAAGGSDLTERVRGFLAHKSGESSGQYSLAKAERAKCTYCNPLMDGEKDAEVAGEIARWTQEIYTEPLQEVLKWLSAQGKRAGLPMLLTGGAMQNHHLQQLVYELFKNSKVAFVPTTSIQLTECIAKHGLVTKSELALFGRITRGFGHGTAILKIAFDISGGLLTAKLSESL